VRTRRAVEKAEGIRDFAETTHRAKSWSRERPRHRTHRSDSARLDVRFVMTNFTLNCPRTVYPRSTVTGSSGIWIKPTPPGDRH